MLIVFSIIAYSLIILKGDMIGVPFILYLFSALFEGNMLTRFFALFAIIGLISLLVLMIQGNKTWRLLVMQIIIFLLLLLPVLERLTSFPISTFNYPSFIIPCSIFVILYIQSVFISLRGIQKQKI